MITIDLERRYSLGKSGARQAADSLANELKDRLGLFGLVAEWKHDTLQLSVSTGDAEGTRGAVALSEDGVRITLSLARTPSLMRETIELAVAQFLKKAFSS